MEFWQALSAIGLGTVLGALVTARSLRRQSEANDRRAEAERRHQADERQADRAADRERREQERRDALRDHWRDQRTRAHGDLLALLSEALQRLSQLEMTLPYNDGEEFRDDVRTLTLEQVQKTSDALSQVSLFAGEEAGEAGATSWRLVRFAHWSIEMAPHQVRGYGETRERQLEVIRQYGIDARESYREYTRLVRAELGTKD